MRANEHKNEMQEQSAWYGSVAVTAQMSISEGKTLDELSSEELDALAYACEDILRERRRQLPLEGF